MEVTLTIQTPHGPLSTPMTGGRVRIGRDAEADLCVEDRRLAPLHASVHRVGDKVWVEDSGTARGSFVNGRRVPARGLALKNGDRIELSDRTSVVVAIRRPSVRNRVSRQGRSPGVPRGALVAAVALTTLAAVALAASGSVLLGREDGVTSTPEPARAEALEAVAPPASSGPALAAVQPVEIGPVALYAEMPESERLRFIDREARRVSTMVGTRPYAFTDDVLAIIKRHLDGYASRRTSSSRRTWSEGLPALYERASRYAPTIGSAFRGRGLSPVIGLYVVMIESEYHACLTSPAGAKGMFQFMPRTAAGYGVDPSERCDVERMAPVCAHYFADLIAEFGSDSLSVALAIASYNRGEGGIRTDLHKVLDGENRERSFWTLVENEEALPPGFRNENIRYVPKFFAAAIIGENPRAFGLDVMPLSTYASELAASSASVGAGIASSDPDPPHNDADRSRLDRVERAAVAVVKRVSSDASTYAFPDRALGDIADQVDEYTRTATLPDVLRALSLHGQSVAADARREGLPPALVLYAAMAELDGGRVSGDPVAVARKVLPDLAWLQKTFGSGVGDSSLLVVAAYKAGGRGSAASHPLLGRLRGLASSNPALRRNVWYLRERGALRDDEYSFVIRFLALGAIAQNPERFGVHATPLAL
jgi:soluble lytic murein transglycosylase-like protein